MLATLETVPQRDQFVSPANACRDGVRRVFSDQNASAWKLHHQAAAEPADVAVSVSPSDIVKHQSASWDGVAAEVVQATRRERTVFDFEAQVHLLALFERGARCHGETRVEGAPTSSLRDFKQKLLFVPAGHRYEDWQDPLTLTRVVYFYFDPAKLAKDVALDLHDSLMPKLFFEDAAIWATGRKLAALIQRPLAGNRLYFDALGLVLAHEIVRSNQGVPRMEPPQQGGLAPWQQRVVANYIEEHLADPVRLATLANLARLSPYYFCRAFKQSFGAPPHRYHTSRRIERAKSLLAQSRASVTEVGSSLGFNETSSFTAAFRKATGRTPTAYRRSLD
jgi:AraC-like DNA-binding protein